MENLPGKAGGEFTLQRAEEQGVVDFSRGEREKKFLRVN
jgi:hypothetical protein